MTVAAIFMAMLIGVSQALANPCTTRETRTLVAQIYRSPGEAYTRLTCLEQHFIAQGDRRAIFTSVYALTTLRVIESLDTGAYHDPAWVSAYLVTFANLCRQALWSYENGQRARVPRAWRIAFDTARSGKNLIVQDAWLGVNAHVMRDLAHALAAVGIDPHRSAKYADHTAINQVLTVIFDEVQLMLTDLYAAGLTEIDMALGNLDEVLFGISIQAGREQAWVGAERLTDAPSVGAQAFIAQQISQHATRVASLLLSPRLRPELMERLHELEGSDPVSTFCQSFPCASPYPH